MQKISGLIILLALCLTSCRPPDSALTESRTFNADNLDRAAWQKPSVVINRLGDLTGKTVADIGAGTGYFAFRLASKAQRTIAIEIDPTMIDLMEGIKVNLPAEMQSRFETRLAKPNSPLLKPNEADLAIIINTITYIDQPQRYLQTLAQGLSSEGQIMILDYKTQHINLPDVPPIADRISTQALSRMLTQAGYTDVAIDSNTLDYQYMVFAEKK